MKLNQQQYAEKIGISQAAVSKKINRYLTGKIAKSELPGVNKIEKIGRIFVIFYTDK